MYRVRTHARVQRLHRSGRGPMRKTFLSVAMIAASALVLASCAMPADDPNFNANAGGLNASAASEAAVSQSGLEAALLPPT